MTTEQWLIEEIKFINEKMSFTLNGRLKCELVECDDSKKEITLKYPLQDWQVNGLNTLHGGIMSTMLDLTMCMAIYCYSRQSIPPTISMTTNYLRPIPMKGYVLVKANVTSIGQKNATAYGEVINPENKKIASTSIGTYAIIPKK